MNPCLFLKKVFRDQTNDPQDEDDKCDDLRCVHPLQVKVIAIHFPQAETAFSMGDSLVPHFVVNEDAFPDTTKQPAEGSVEPDTKFNPDAHRL